MCRGDGELPAIAACRVQQIVGLVELQIRRHPDQRIVLGALRGSDRIDIGELHHIGLCALERDPGGQHRAKAPLEAGRYDRPAAVIGDRGVIRYLGRRQEILVDRQKIGTAKIRPEPADLLAHLCGDPQMFGIAEQIAVFPEGAAGGPLTGVVREADTDRAVQPLGRVDRHAHVFGVVGIGRRRNPHGAEQAAFDQRAACLFDLSLLVNFAALPADTPPRDKRDRAVRAPRSRAGRALHRPGIERVGDIHRLRAVVDLDPGVRYLGKRMAAVSERRQERRLGCHHRGSARRIAGFERQLVLVLQDRQGLRVGSQHLDRGDMVERARLDRDRDLCRIGLGVEIVREFRSPIAEAVCGIREPAEIAVGAPPQRFFGSPRLVLKRLQLGDLVQQVGQIAVLGAGDFGAIFRSARTAGPATNAAVSTNIRRDRRTRIPSPQRERRSETRYSRGRCPLSSLTSGISRHIRRNSSRHKLLPDSATLHDLHYVPRRRGMTAKTLGRRLDGIRGAA
jgi:hypothetical protein